MDEEPLADELLLEELVLDESDEELDAESLEPFVLLEPDPFAEEPEERLSVL